MRYNKGSDILSKWNSVNLPGDRQKLPELYKKRMGSDCLLNMVKLEVSLLFIENEGREINKL